MALTFDTDVRYLPGVGEARAAALAKLGIETVGALLYHFPRGYEFRGNEKPLADAVPGETASFILTAASDVQNTMIRRGMTISKLKAFDESGSCEILYFNQPFVKDSIIKGGEYRFYGKLTRDKGKNILNSDGSIKIRGITVTPKTPVKKSIVKTAFEDANQYM